MNKAERVSVLRNLCPYEWKQKTNNQVKINKYTRCNWLVTRFIKRMKEDHGIEGDFRAKLGRVPATREGGLASKPPGEPGVCQPAVERCWLPGGGSALGSECGKKLCVLGGGWIPAPSPWEVGVGGHVSGPPACGEAQSTDIYLIAFWRLEGLHPGVAGLVPPEASVLGTWTAALSVSSPCVLTSSFHEDSSPVGSKPILMTSFNMDLEGDSPGPSLLLQTVCRATQDTDLSWS